VTSRPAVREAVRSRALGRCEYCLASEALCGQHFELEHVVPRSVGGTGTLANLAFACRACNAYKGAATEAVDPHTGAIAALFNPRLDAWSDHFAWDATGALIVPQTPVGRATVEALHLNETLRRSARLIWSAAGWHPPA